MVRIAWIPWRWWRRAVQVICVGVFLYLLRRTEYYGEDTLPDKLNILFRIDPVVAAAAMLAARRVVGLVLWSLVTIGVTAVLGRVFCGWVCPVGTMLDWAHRIMRPVARRTNARLEAVAERGRPIRHFLLVAVLLCAWLGFPLLGYVDPFSLLVRGLTFWVDPMAYRGVDAGSVWVSDHAPQRVTGASEAVYSFLKDNHIVAGHEAHYLLAGMSLGILGAVFALELVARRCWCRYVCPVGAALGLVARVSLVKRLPVKVCKGCGHCRTDCRMGAFADQDRFSPESCTLCMDCVDDCPHQIGQFTFKRSKQPVAPMQQSRRAFMGAAATGIALPLIVKAARVGHGNVTDEYLLRPPGVGEEQSFMDLCVRCGECMKVCQTNVLQPTGWQSGIEGVFSPRLVPRMGYCEYNCNLCGQVCPTGAIPRLVLEAKQKAVIGKAQFDRKVCLPWAQNSQCICCEEHCPLPEKAIQLEAFKYKDKDGQEQEVQRPHVVRERCIGCGICENSCPLQDQDKTGIRVARTEAVQYETVGKAHRGYRGKRFEAD